MNKKFIYTKLIDVADFDNPNFKSIFESIYLSDRNKYGLKSSSIRPDAGKWKSAMTLKSFHDLDIIKPGNNLAGIGAGIEQTSFYLSSKGCVCFVVDKYLSDTPWSEYAPIGMMIDPKKYSDLDTNEHNIIPVHSDARLLKLPSNYFSGVYSNGTIEHLGSLKNTSYVLKEIYRILKPGGYASISTEFRLDGPVDKPWFDDNLILFTNKLIEEWLVKPSGLKLIGEIQNDISKETYQTRTNIDDYLSSNSILNSKEEKKYIFPNLILHHEGFLYCSVHLLFQKPNNSSLEENRETSPITTSINNNYTSDISNLIFKTKSININGKLRENYLDKLIRKIKNLIDYK